MRGQIRKAFFGLLDRVAQTPDARAAGAQCLAGLLHGSAPVPAGLETLPSPYADLGKATGRTCERAGAIFITGRFRSGSTLLWNLFRNTPGCTSYYEPLNERRWFDPQTRGEQIDQSHRHAEDYWREYDGLAELGRHFRPEWIHRHLYMGADAWDEDLLRYVEILIERSAGRPVLQFNRVDFRLAWLRRHFPQATVIHLYRHPRDQWCSTLRGDVRREARTDAFAPFDHFYLLTWARDLRFVFPFVDEARVRHPYQLFYYLWKLSYCFGRIHAHASLSFEDLVTRPRQIIEELMAVAAIANVDLDRLEGLISPPPLGKWNSYADDAWFRDLESECERVLADYLDGSKDDRNECCFSRVLGSESSSAIPAETGSGRSLTWSHAAPGMR